MTETIGTGFGDGFFWGVMVVCAVMGLVVWLGLRGIR